MCPELRRLSCATRLPRRMNFQFLDLGSRNAGGRAADCTGREVAEMRTRISCAGAVAFVLCWPLTVQGQQQPFFQDEGEELWGVGGSYTTKWVSPREFRWLIGAEDVDLQGGDYRIGFVRGRLLGGEWGLSYVRQTVKEGSAVSLSRSFPDDVDLSRCLPEAFDDGDCGVFYETNSGLMLRGFELHRFIPFATFSDRVQIGMNVAAGGGWYKGTATRLVVNRGDPASGALGESRTEVLGSELTLPRRFDTPVPIFNLDVAVAGIVPGGLKVRGGAGLYGFPGRRTVVVSATYFFGAE